MGLMDYLKGQFLEIIQWTGRLARHARLALPG
jgi:membrane protease subunit (stomatin/prohibitin family)